MKRAKHSAPLVISDEQNELKIYTVKGRASSFYQLAYYRGGKRIRKTFADLSEARREARLQLGSMAGEHLQARNLSAAEMERHTIAARTLEPSGVALHICAEMFAKAHDILGGRSIIEAAEYFVRHHDSKRPRKPIPDLIKEFIESRQAMRLSERYINNVSWMLGRFGDVFGKVPLDDLQSANLERWLESRRKMGMCSRRHFRIILVAFGNFLKQRGYLSADRLSVFERMTTYRDEVKPVEIFTTEEIRTLLEGAHILLIPYLAIGAFAGLRGAEICRLDWKHIRFDRGFIECEASMTKTRQRRLVPISDNLRAWIEPLSQREGSIVLHRHTSNALLNLAERLGMDWKRNALRHSYISYRLAQMPDTARVALECGNSPDVIFRHYRELVTPDQAAEWFRVLPPADYPQGMSKQLRGQIGTRHSIKNVGLRRSCLLDP